ncbi:Trk system potassium transporter TrkA [Maribellus sp. CM-23]|uniref:Trk system potassium transporter TrkA n=1 Tax=Maribellus sp. CM-23 TaxID=2781026 RepID=UPI001F011EC2|nr:Trk system potassium transporter TrkA [Maribellus sp. CM-23]MCE4565479.1 Trk system potassium transporter TrkA [Maribellus sp. CM-23]
MKVVIAGAGEVGTHLARMLSKEDHDIVLLDDSQERLSKISSEVDLMTVIGSAHSFSDLKKADLAKADLFIAVTPFEERNVLACAMAKYLGVSRTIARINNQEYLQEKYRAKLNDMGINELIYPESLAAKEIVASVKQTVTRQMIEFSNGKLLLLGIKVRDNAPILNKTFEELAIEHQHLLVVAIKRDNETIIPNGHDSIQNDDVVFFVTTPSEQSNVLELTGKKQFEVKNIMFMGGSRIAQKAVEKLGESYRIKIIESDRERCEEIADRFSNVLVINGDGRNLDLLKEEGIDKMDAFVATTGNSETNILGCNLAKTLGVRRTVAEVENLAYMKLADNTGIGSIINKKLIAASYIYRFTLNAEISKVKCLTASEAEVFEFIAKPGAKITLKPVKDIGFPAEAKIGGVIRGNMGYIAHGYTQVQEGDKVVVFTLPSGIKKIEKFFK